VPNYAVAAYNDLQKGWHLPGEKTTKDQDQFDCTYEKVDQ
jgi:hypothetical protein